MCRGEEVNTMQYDGDNDAFAAMYSRLRGQLHGFNESSARRLGYELEELKHMLRIGVRTPPPSRPLPLTALLCSQAR